MLRQPYRSDDHCRVSVQQERLAVAIIDASAIVVILAVVYAFHGFSTGTCVCAKSPTFRETIVRLW